MSKDQAARIAEKEYQVDKWSSAEERGYAMSMRPTLEKRIRRAITTAVRKERERCVKCVEAEPELPGPMPDGLWNILRKDKDTAKRALVVAVQETKSDIIKAINGGKR